MKIKLIASLFLFMAVMSCAQSCLRENNKQGWALVDQPDLLNLIFYPRKVAERTIPGARNFRIPVEKDVYLGARWHLRNRDLPTVLFFHGNGEVVPDYDDAVDLFEESGLNFFIVDYRGYGWSTGSPSYEKMLLDANVVSDFFTGKLKEEYGEGRWPRPYLMGRSLGSASVCEIAANHGSDYTGLILESGFSNAPALMRRLGVDLPPLGKELEEKISNNTKLAHVQMKVLIIHGENDQLIPPINARQNFESIPHQKKTLLIIPGAEHNNVMVFHRPYFNAVREFVRQK